MDPYAQIKAFRDCLIFLAVHVALAVLVALVAPVAAEDVPRPIELWGWLLQAIFPNIEGYSGLTTFRTQAWLALVAMWTLMPVSLWWVSRVTWVLPDPNLFGRPRRPWLVIVMGVVFVSMVVIFAMSTPTQSMTSYSRGGRVLRSAIQSPVHFGVFLGFIYAALAIGLGSLPRMYRLHRGVTTDKMR